MFGHDRIDRIDGGCDCPTHVHSVSDNYHTRLRLDRGHKKISHNISRVFCVILFLSTLSFNKSGKISSHELKLTYGCSNMKY